MAGRTAAGQGFATFSNLEMQHSPKIFCIFLQKVLAKNNDVWNKLCALIDEKYEMERLWNKGGKAWTYEYKYRRGGKTLCALYARENCIGFMIIFGKDERAKF